jgi:ABC-2 type transport system ATP-binding protein
VRNLLRSLADSGTSIFVSSHILSELEVIADHLVVVDHGKVLFQGAVKGLLAAQKPRLAVRGGDQADLERLEQIATTAGFSSEVIDNQLVIMAPESFAAQLNKAAFDSGIILTQLQITRPTLEESFFEITGGER